MIPGYHAGEMWLHEPAKAIRHLVNIGFRSVAIRSRQGLCVPGESAFKVQWNHVLHAAIRSNVRLVIDTEADFVVGSHSSSLPSLASVDDLDSAVIELWIEDWIRAAAMRPGTIVSLASGIPQDNTTEQALEVLAERLGRLCRQADSAGVHLAIRPAASHVIGSVSQFERLRQWLSSDVSLGLAADIGEMIHAGEMPLISRLQRQVDDLRLVYLCDSSSTDADSDRLGMNGVGAGGLGAGRTGIGRMDVPIGTGEVAVERIVAELAKFTVDVPVVVRVANQAAAGMAAPRQAMQELQKVPAWRAACQGGGNVSRP